MTPLRPKDRLFLATVLPLALLAAYVILYRMPTERRNAYLESAIARLVEVDDFPMARQLAERRLKEVESALAEAKSQPRSVTHGEESAVERDRKLVALFRASGLIVRGIDDCKEGARNLRRYRLGGTYDALVNALDQLSKIEGGAKAARVRLNGGWEVEFE